MMMFLPHEVRLEARARNKICLRKLRGLWIYTCPWCQVWNSGEQWASMMERVINHFNLIHADYPG